MEYALKFCTCVENSKPAHTYTFTGPCIKTNKMYSVTVPAKGLYRYHQGDLIQKCFPELSAGDREFLQTGYSPEGWDQLFDEKDEVEDE